MYFKTGKSFKEAVSANSWNQL